MDRTQPVTMGRELLQKRHILLTPYETGSLGASVKQVEIQLRFPPASHARVVSAIANFTAEQNSRRSKNDGKLKLPRTAQDEPGRPRKPPRGFPDGHFEFKNAIWAKSKNMKIVPSEPSSGTSGVSRRPLDLTSRAARVPSSAPDTFHTWCEALSLHFASPGATSGQNATCDNALQFCQLSTVFIDPRPKSDRSGPWCTKRKFF